MLKNGLSVNCKAFLEEIEKQKQAVEEGSTITQKTIMDKPNNKDTITNQSIVKASRPRLNYALEGGAVEDRSGAAADLSLAPE